MVFDATDAGVHGAPWHIHHQVQAERRSGSQGHDEQGRRVVFARWDQHAGDARRVRHSLHSAYTLQSMLIESLVHCWPLLCIVRGFPLLVNLLSSTRLGCPQTPGQDEGYADMG